MSMEQSAELGYCRWRSGGASVAGYQFYLVDREDHVASRETVNTVSDREAPDKARKYVAEHPAVLGAEVLLGEGL